MAKMMQWLSVLSILLCCSTAYTPPLQDQDLSSLDTELAAGIQATTHEYLNVEHQLTAARQVADLFTKENEQLQLYLTETRVQMETMKNVVFEEIQTVKEEVETVLQSMVKNITKWREKYEDLKATNERNRNILQHLRDQKQEEVLLEIQEQEQREKIKLQEMESQDKLRKQREQEEAWKQQEKQKEDELRKLREQEKFRKQQEAQKQQETKSGAVNRGESDKVVELPDGGGFWKKLVAWYLSAEQFAWGMYRQLVLPVVVIMVFFGLVTVAIARLYAAKQARRTSRVLYSGYPKSYRPKAKQVDAPIADAAGLRSRIEHRAVPRRERNDFIGH